MNTNQCNASTSESVDNVLEIGAVVVFCASVLGIAFSVQEIRNIRNAVMFRVSPVEVVTNSEQNAEVVRPEIQAIEEQYLFGVQTKVVVDPEVYAKIRRQSLKKWITVFGVSISVPIGVLGLLLLVALRQQMRH